MLCRFLALSTLLILGLSAALPCRADEPVGLRVAHDELKAALNPGGDPPPDQDRITHLKAALDALKNLPPNIWRGRYQATSYINSAIYEIKNSGSPNQINSDIRDADSLVRDMEG